MHTWYILMPIPLARRDLLLTLLSFQLDISYFFLYYCRMHNITWCYWGEWDLKECPQHAKMFMYSVFKKIDFCYLIILLIESDFLFLIWFTKHFPSSLCWFYLASQNIMVAQMIDIEHFWIFFSTWKGLIPQCLICNFLLSLDIFQLILSNAYRLPTILHVWFTTLLSISYFMRQNT